MTPTANPGRGRPPHPRLLAARRTAWVGATAAGGAAVGTVLAQQLIKAQARTARRLVGKPLGTDALRADRVYKSSYGRRVELLLLGDSIAAGLGADRPKHTLGAELASRVAKHTRRAVRLHTAAQVGSESSMLRTQLAGLPPGYRADVAVIVVGGNDVTHRVRTAVSVEHLELVVGLLREQGTEVVVGTCPDLGALTVLPQPLRGLARRSSRQLATAQRDAVTRSGGRAVSLAEVVGPFFVTQPDRMFAEDRFHPSSAGYRRTAKAIVPSVLAALGHTRTVPFGHHGPAGPREAGPVSG